MREKPIYNWERFPHTHAPLSLFNPIPQTVSINPFPTKDVYIRPPWCHATTKDVYIRPRTNGIAQSPVARRLRAVSLLLENPRRKSCRARVTRERGSREKRARRETSEKRDCNGFIQRL